MVRKTKKGKKKSKKLTPEEEKEALIETLMVKCSMSRDEILKLYDDFHEEHPEGVISRDKYVASIKVNISCVNNEGLQCIAMVLSHGKMSKNTNIQPNLWPNVTWFIANSNIRHGYGHGCHTILTHTICIIKAKILLSHMSSFTFQIKSVYWILFMTSHYSSITRVK